MDSIGALSRGQVVRANPFLRPFLTSHERIHLPATNGSLSVAQSADIFPGFIDQNFRKWGLDVASPQRPAALVEIYEISQNGAFQEIFEGFSVSLSELHFTQHQIVVFAQHFAHLLQAQYGTFFPFLVNGNYYVAGLVYDSKYGKSISVRHYLDGRIWPSDRPYRFVVTRTSFL